MRDDSVMHQCILLSVPNIHTRTLYYMSALFTRSFFFKSCNNTIKNSRIYITVVNVKKKTYN